MICHKYGLNSLRQLLWMVTVMSHKRPVKTIDMNIRTGSDEIIQLQYSIISIFRKKDADVQQEQL